MLFLAENLKSLRKAKDFTQEEVAEILNVSPQSVSKWERGETLPDITLLPALANLFKTSVDALIGMDRINNRQTRDAIFTAGHDHLRNGDIKAAVDVYSEALKTFPDDIGVMSDLAIALALDGDPENLARAVALCERVLTGYQAGKVQYTTRAALCFIYMKAGDQDKAVAAARNLPHIRESRESVLNQLEKKPAAADVDSYLKFIAIGETDEQDVIEIDFGVNMIAVCTEHNLLDKIEALRNELGAPYTNAGFRILPQIRIRDKTGLAPDKVRVRHFAEYPLVREYADCGEAADDIIRALREIAQKNADVIADGVK